MKAQAFRRNLAWVQSSMGNQLEELSAGLMAPWFALHEQPPSQLFHYTTVEGLLGILGGQCLWATHSAYLNDPSEIVHAHSIIQQALEDEAKAEEHPWAKELLFRARYAIHPDDGMYQYFVISFCEDADLLSQWRGYSNRSGGYAMGFDTRTIKALADPSPALTLRCVIYDHDRQRKLIASTIAAALAEFKRVVASDAKEELANRIVPYFVMFLRDHFSEYHFSFKNLAFREEKEWRLIVQTDSASRQAVLKDLQFRAAGGIAVPYLPVALMSVPSEQGGRLPITRIVYGPTINAQRAKHSLRALLDKCGHDSASIESSQVPLRS